MLMEEQKRRDSETEEEYENRIAEFRSEMKEEEEEEESQSASGPQLKPPDVEERKRSFSDRQKILEEKKIQQQREEAERSRVEEEKRLKKDAKRRERKERERREAMRIQKLEEQNKNDFVSYYGPNFSVHPALTNRVANKPPPPVIRQEYDAFSEGMTPERIIGATDELGELSFLVKWKGTDEADFVPAKKAKLHCPELVIRFYEGIIAWK